MKQRNDDVGAVLDRLVPPIEDPTDDWQRIVADARLDEAPAGWKVSFRPALPTPVTHADATRRVRLRLRVALVAGAAVLVAIGFAVFRGGDAAHQLTGTTLRVRYVTRRLAAALATPNDLILYTRFHGSNPAQQVGQSLPPITNEDWSDASERRSRGIEISANGTLITQTATSCSRANQRTTEVANYATKTIDEFNLPIPPCVSPYETEPTAERLRSEVTSGGLKIVGTGRFDGQPAIHLRRTEQPNRLDIWVNETTYFPIRWENYKNSSGYSGGIKYFAWLPPTPQNLAKLNFVSPHGFKLRVLHRGH